MTLQQDFKLLFYDPWFDLLSTADKNEYYISSITNTYTDAELKEFIEKMYDAKQWNTMYKRLNRRKEEFDEELEIKLAKVRIFNESFDSNEERGFENALEEIELFFEGHIWKYDPTSYIDEPKRLRGWRTIIKEGFRRGY